MADIYSKVLGQVALSTTSITTVFDATEINKNMHGEYNLFISNTHTAALAVTINLVAAGETAGTKNTMVLTVQPNDTQVIEWLCFGRGDSVYATVGTANKIAVQAFWVRLSNS